MDTRWSTITSLPGGSFSVGLGINATGEVTGYGNSSSGTRGWRAGPTGTAVVSLPTLGGSFLEIQGITIVGDSVCWLNKTVHYAIEPKFPDPNG